MTDFMTRTHCLPEDSSRQVEAASFKVRGDGKQCTEPIERLCARCFFPAACQVARPDQQIIKEEHCRVKSFPLGAEFGN